MHKQGRGNKTHREMYIFLSCPWETRSKKPLLSPAGVASLLPPFLFLAVRCFLHCSLTEPRTFASIVWILGKFSLSSCCYHGRQIFLTGCLMAMHPPTAGMSVSGTERGQSLSGGFEAAGEGKRGKLKEYCTLQEHLGSLRL